MVVLASVPSPSTSSAHTASRQGSTCLIVVSSGCRIAAPQRKEHIHIALGNRTVWHHHANRADGCIPDVFVSLHWARRHFDWIARVGSRRQLDLRHSRCVSSCCFRICLQAYVCMSSFCCFIFSRFFVPAFELLSCRQDVFPTLSSFALKAEAIRHFTTLFNVFARTG